MTQQKKQAGPTCANDDMNIPPNEKPDVDAEADRTWEWDLQEAIWKTLCDGSTD